MYCPNCKQEFDGKFCPECGTKLIEKPVTSGVSVNLSGDANAISMHTSDSHNVHNEDKSVHHTVNNITQAQKTKDELKQEKLKQYLEACRSALADNRLDPSEEVYLRRLSLELDIDEATADRLLNEVKQLANSRLQDTELPRRTKRELDKLADNLDNNDAQAIMQQLYGLEASVANYKNDELQYNYYLVLAALCHEKCIEKYECSKVDNYWLSFWAYVAYLKANKPANASQIFYSMDKKFPNQPQDNLDLLAAAGSLIKNNKKDAKDDLEDVEGAYSPLLLNFAKSIYFLADSKTAKKMGADENTCAFYLVNFFGQKDPKVKAEEERLKREAAEAERKRKEEEEKEAKCKAKEEAKRKSKEAEEERKKTAEEERRRLEAERNAKEEKKRKAKEEAKRKAEEEKRRKILKKKFSFSTNINYKMVDKEIRPAAYLGNASAQFVLGKCYYLGQGVLQDYAEAVKWYKMAAEQGDHRAQCNLAGCYKDAKGVHYNIKLAKKWYGLAAQQGNEAAEMILQKWS